MPLLHLPGPWSCQILANVWPKGLHKRQALPNLAFECYCETIVLLEGKSLVLILKYFEIEMYELVLIRGEINFVSQIHLNQLSLAFD